MLTKTDAIVLKSMKYSDTSKIVTFYTREFGAIRCIAKGARANKSKFGAALEPLTYVGIVLYKKETSELHLLSQADVVRTWKKITKELDRLTVALSILELLHQISRTEERNVPLFELAVQALKAVDDADAPAPQLLSVFELRMVSLFGYPPQLDRCDVCGKSTDEFPPDGSVFIIARGCLVCGGCRSDRGIRTHRPSPEIPGLAVSAIPMSHAALIAFLKMKGADWPSLASNVVTREIGNEIGDIMRLYVRYHFEGIGPLRTAEIFRQ